MKASIITIIDNQNFGTYLQAFALCQKVEDMGLQTELIDYNRKSLSLWALTKHRVLSTINMLKWPKRFYRVFRSWLLQKKDKKFVRHYLTSTCYKSYKQLMQNPPEADVYITGSDQVWNSWYNQGVDRSFYLDFAPEGALRIAYAASIGMPEIPANEAKETAMLLSKYKAISVREKSAVDILASINVDTKNIHPVLDPTLLLNKEQWKKHISLGRLVQERYLLIYSVEKHVQNKIVSELARKVAKDRGLKIIGISYSGLNSKFDYCDKQYFRATPDVFLSLMYHSDYVIVSSFHGTAFAINFNKEFLTVAPQKFNSRVANILSICNLEDRLVNTDSYDYKLATPIDYSRINKILESERIKSSQFLHDSIFQ